MLRSILALALLLPAAALACEGESAGGKSCPMPSAAALPADGARARLAVSGMHCGCSASKVQAALTALPGVTGATVDAATGTVEVAYDSGKVGTGEMIKAVTGAGFTATLKG